MSPWLVLAAFTAGINLSIFVFIRGRWDRSVLAFALAALLGAAVGSAAGDLTRIHVLRVGDFNMLMGSVFAQLAMLATLLLGVAAEARGTETE